MGSVAGGCEHPAGNRQHQLPYLSPAAGCAAWQCSGVARGACLGSFPCKGSSGALQPVRLTIAGRPGRSIAECSPDTGQIPDVCTRLSAFNMVLMVLALLAADSQTVNTPCAKPADDCSTEMYKIAVEYDLLLVCQSLAEELPESANPKLQRFKCLTEYAAHHILSIHSMSQILVQTWQQHICMSVLARSCCMSIDDSKAHPLVCDATLRSPAKLLSEHGRDNLVDVPW